MKINNNIIYKLYENSLDLSEENKFNDKNILITGSNGLIGTHLLYYFVSLKKRFKINIFATSFSEDLDINKFDNDFQKSFTYFSWDATKNFVNPYDVNFDFVFYCSGYAQPSKFISDPISTSLINVIGVSSILKILKEDATFIYMSSSEIYGDPDLQNIPTKETYRGNNSLESNRASYIYSKMLGEVLCLSFKESLNIKICRISLTYGPGTSYDDERVLQQMIKKAIVNNEIELIDDGSAIRTYSYIRDTIEMIVKISLLGKETIYNIANDKNSITILELAKIVGNFLNVKVIPNNSSNNLISNNSPKNVIMSMEKYHKEFDKKEPLDMKKGVETILKYFSII